MRTRCIGTPLVSALQNKPLGAARVLLDHMGDIPIKVGERRAESLSEYKFSPRPCLEAAECFEVDVFAERAMMNLWSTYNEHSEQCDCNAE
ncbi:hypothetical protein PG995_006083 [Apiospora arundinis]